MKVLNKQELQAATMETQNEKQRLEELRKLAEGQNEIPLYHPEQRMSTNEELLETLPGLENQQPISIGPTHDPIITHSNSTYVNPIIKSKQEVIDWCLGMLGYPLVTVELTEQHFDIAIANALETYTKYASFPEKYLLRYLNDYEYGEGRGLNLKKDNIAVIREISVGVEPNAMWTIPIWMTNRGWPGSGRYAGSFITYQNMCEFREMARRLLALDYDFNYNRLNGYLELFPAPRRIQNVPIVITCEIEPPLEQLYANQWVRKFCLAYLKVILGQIRGKFENISLPGGGSIKADIGEEGKNDLAALKESLAMTESHGNLYYFA